MLNTGGTTERNSFSRIRGQAGTSFHILAAAQAELALFLAEVNAQMDKCLVHMAELHRDTVTCNLAKTGYSIYNKGQLHARLPPNILPKQ